jgi:putative transcription factor
MDCELCGRRASGKAEVEGTIIAVCDACSGFGKKIYEEKPVKIKDRPLPKSPEEVYFVSGFPSLIRQKRESLSLTREQLAEKIKEKVNVVERIEKGARPEKSVAEKLEKFLGIKIISFMESEKTVFNRSSPESLTFGDVVTVKKRKKQLL